MNAHNTYLFMKPTRVLKTLQLALDDHFSLPPEQPGLMEVSLPIGGDWN